MTADPFECPPITCGDNTFRPRVITADERLRVVSLTGKSTRSAG